MGVVSLKVDVSSETFCALRAPNNTNPRFQNPGSATGNSANALLNSISAYSPAPTGNHRLQAELGSDCTTCAAAIHSEAKLLSHCVCGTIGYTRTCF